MTLNSINNQYYDWYNKSEKLRMFYPSELVIGFIKNNIKPKSKILDLGCGSGRHVICIAELGHKAYGIDLSDNGFSVCKEIAKEKKLKINLKKTLMNNTKYKDNFFNGVVCISSIGGNLLQQQIEIIQETYRILCKDGVFLVNFYGLKDGLFKKLKKCGEEIEQRTLKIPGNKFHPFSDTPVPDYTRHFSTIEEIKTLFKSFSECKIFEMYLPYGTANMNKNVPPVHHIYVMAKK